MIIGPPGTGKSQTIANMIANCLANGKTVLFVAEKTAALNVVHRRLKAHGLGDHCVELHSNKADRKFFLAQLRSSWEKGRAVSSDWVEVNHRLKLRRDVLNAYVAALHQRHANGLTAYAGLGIALLGRDRHAPELSWSHRDLHDDVARTRLGDLAEEIGRVFASVERAPVLACVDAPEWSSAWQERLLMTARDLAGKSTILGATLAAFLPHLGLTARSDAASAELERLSLLATTLCESAGRDYRIAFDPDFTRLGQALAELEGSIRSYRETEAELSATFTRESVAAIPVEALERNWREAGAAIWPRSWLGRRRVSKLLQGFAAAGLPDPGRDLPVLRRLQALRTSVETSGLAGKSLAFAGLDTDVMAIDRHLAGATKLRDRPPAARARRRGDSRGGEVNHSRARAWSGGRTDPACGFGLQRSLRRFPRGEDAVRHGCREGSVTHRKRDGIVGSPRGDERPGERSAIAARLDELVQG